MSGSAFVSVNSMFAGRRAMIDMTAIAGTMPVVVVRSVVWRPGDNEVAKEVRLMITIDQYESGVVPASSS